MKIINFRFRTDSGQLSSNQSTNKNHVLRVKSASQSSGKLPEAPTLIKPKRPWEASGDMRGLDLSKWNLRGERLEACYCDKRTKLPKDLNGVSLRDSGLFEMDLSECNLTNADLRGCDLTETLLPNELNTEFLSALLFKGNKKSWIQSLSLLAGCSTSESVTYRIQQESDPSFHNHYLTLHRTPEGNILIKYNDNESQIPNQNGLRINCKFEITSDGQIIPIKDSSYIPLRFGGLKHLME